MENMSGRSQQLYIIFFTNILFYILKYENIFVGKSEDKSCSKILEAESDVKNIIYNCCDLPDIFSIV
jgi:hypothetical protein